MRGWATLPERSRPGGAEGRPPTRSGSEGNGPGLEGALWRALAVYRGLTLAYAAVLIVVNHDGYAHPAGGWVVLAVMVVWTAYAGGAFPGARRRWPLLVADLAVASGCLLATAWVETAANLEDGRPTLPVAWVAAAVLAWAVAGGRWAERSSSVGWRWAGAGGRWLGVVAALVLAGANLLVHALAGTAGAIGLATFNGIVLLLLAGLVGGHVVRLALDAEARLARAVELEAATRERDRLARRIHDSVLQVLAMVRRRGDDLGGEAAELGRLAGEQEEALRSLVGADPAPGPVDELDLRALLTAQASPSVTVSTPATGVPLPARVAREVEAAVAAALDNVRRHCGDGARAWVLLEDDGGTVTVSVRDDGPGMPAGRLAEAAADGRLGVAQSIRGRVRDLGGTVEITSAEGAGTEIELAVPRPRTP